MAPIRPPALRPATTIAVCAPAGPPDPYRLARGIDVLRRRYQVRFDESLLDAGSPRLSFGYLAGPDDQRAEELTAALTDPSVSAIFVARGGYGSMRLIEIFDRKLIAAHPKPIIGFSDATILLHWWLESGVVSIHGPVVTQLGSMDRSELDHLWRLLEDPDYQPTYQGQALTERDRQTIALPCMAGKNPKVPGPGDEREILEGRLWGGNLTMLSSRSGWCKPPSGPTIAIFEDLAEAPYRLDRMVTQLHLSGQLGPVLAAALGTFSPPAQPTRTPAARPPDDPPHAGRSQPDLARIVACRLAELGKPSVMNMPWGHVGKNQAVALGLSARLNQRDGTLTCTESAVSSR